MRIPGFAPLVSALLIAAFVSALAVPPASAWEDPFLRWDFVDRRMGSDLRAFPVEREWESPDATSIQLIGMHLGGHSVGAGETNRAVVLSEEDGVASRESALAGAEGRWGQSLGRGFGIRAGLTLLSDGREGADEIQLGETELIWNGGRHRWSLGRSKLRWGAGASGSLLVGGTAPPRWQLSWRTERAVRVPTLGWDALSGVTWSGSVFLAYLDDELRDIADPLVFGHRFSLQPRSWCEITGTRTILFGGEGRTSRLDLGGVLDMLFAQNENLRGDRPPSDSDQRASLELRVRPPVESLDGRWEGLELFWEYAGEDMNEPPLPSAVAHHMGVMTRVAGWTFLAEGIETVTGLNRWYDHIVYGREAYAYRRFLLGHSMGGDARMWEWTVWTPPGGLRGKARFGREEFGFFRSERETRHVYELGARVEVREGLVAEVGAQLTSKRDGRVARRSPSWVENRVDLRFTWVPGS